jgi:hypothetical protein
VETTIKASAKVVQDYTRLLINRRAYTLQSLRPHPESGRHYYFRPKARGTGAALSLTSATIRRHLEGELTIGLYAINPATQRSKWVAIDADYAGAMEDLLKVQYCLQQDDVEAALEMSRRGGHLWIFMEKPALAPRVPNLRLQLSVEARSTHQRRWLGGGNRSLPEARRASRGGIRERHSWTAGNSSGSKPAVLVLRRGE